MTAGDRLRAEIAATGPVRFSRFMEVAARAYYTGGDRFGREGDFYTASQVQPAFGVLMAREVRRLLGANRTVVELGPGRGEMRKHFAGLEYVPVDFGGRMPERFRGVVFANEFFDALPVDRRVRVDGEWRESLVTWDGERFAWTEEGVESEEVAVGAAEWMDRIARSMEEGAVVVIDYGYTREERARFESGTLMSYRKHHASEDVLADPGERDITAHVDFTALMEHPAFRVERGVETFRSMLMRVGEVDQFAELRGREAQLKTLLMGMGEVFRVLVLVRK